MSKEEEGEGWIKIPRIQSGRRIAIPKKAWDEEHLEIGGPCLIKIRKAEIVPVEKKVGKEGKEEG